MTSTLTVRDLIERDPYQKYSNLAPNTDKAEFVLDFAWDELDRPVTEFAESFDGGVSEGYVREVLERTSPESIAE